MIRAGVTAVVLMSGQMALASDPATSLRPVQRGGNVSVQPVIVEQSGSIRQPEQDDSQRAAREQRQGGFFVSLRPLFRSEKAAREGEKKQKLRQQGAVCGDVAIQGEAVGRVTGNLRGCVIEDAVRVREVAGVGLSQRAVMDCKTAGALRNWMEQSAKPALSQAGGGLKSVRVAAHFACRTRNNQKGAKLSEHGKGRAIDISGFQLRNGTEVSVLQGWNTKSHGQALRRMHKGACGPFGTVLGPDSNRFHRDHFHFDTARYRSGTFCR